MKSNTDDSWLPKKYYKLQVYVHKLARKYSFDHTCKHLLQLAPELYYFYRAQFQ